MRALANHLNTLANKAEDQGQTDRAATLYHLAAAASPSWSVPHYNLGLLEKSRGNWHDSLAHNQRAATLDPADEAAWWNLAIAATALHHWPEALRAWHAVGIDTAELRDGHLTMPPSTACVRLNPQGDYPEVVWGTRLDAARIEVLNVPLARCGRRYRDILLNDGAPNGERTSGGETYPVFDELAIWCPSSYSTFSATLRLPDNHAHAEQLLATLCDERDIALEDRGTLRMLCLACSQDNPGEHICAENTTAAGDRNFGFATTNRTSLTDTLHQWAAQTSGAGHTEPRLELPGA